MVIYFNFQENRIRGLEAVGGRKLPSLIDLVHSLYCTKACTTVQGVISYH